MNSLLKVLLNRVATVSKINARHAKLTSTIRKESVECKAKYFAKLKMEQSLMDLANRSKSIVRNVHLVSTDLKSLEESLKRFVTCSSQEVRRPFSVVGLQTFLGIQL